MGTDGAWQRKPAAEKQEQPPELGWIPDLIVRRRGEFCLPIPIELTYEGGAKETLVWTRVAQEHQAWWKPLAGREPSAKKLVSVVLDPAQRYWLDLDLSNNRWYAERDTSTPARWSERVLAQAAAALHWFGGIGG
jgi:hypothetical protein